MESLLQKLVTTKKRVDVQKYVHKYLPNNKQKLDRIFNELSHYELPNKKTSKFKVKIIPTNISKNTHISTDYSVESSIKKSHSLIKAFTKKGLFSAEDTYEKGIKIYEMSKQKFLKPLKMNPISPFLKDNRIDNLCEKYELNKEFYESQPANKNQELGFDAEMSEFILKRKQLLKSIQQRKAFKSKFEQPTKKYQHIKSKVRSRSELKLPNKNANLNSCDFNNEQMSTVDFQTESNSIINECNNIPSYQQKQVQIHQSQTFEGLKEKLNKEFDEDLESQIDHDAHQKNKGKSLVLSKFQRYGMENCLLLNRTIARVNSHSKKWFKIK